MVGTVSAELSGVGREDNAFAAGAAFWLAMAVAEVVGIAETGFSETAKTDLFSDGETGPNFAVELFVAITGAAAVGHL